MKGLLTALILGSAFLTGCTAASKVATPVDGGVETIAFATDADRVSVVDAATAVLVQHDFTITLANERLGLIQTDYASVGGVQAMRADSAQASPVLDGLYMRLTVNADERGDLRYVQIKGNFQRMKGGTAPDKLIGLYWMDKLAADMAAELDTEYIPRVSLETYNQALGNATLPSDSQRAPQSMKALRAVGIVAAIFFAATLFAGVLQPSTAR